MRTPWLVLALLAGLALRLPALQADEVKADPSHIARLIDRLGSPRFKEREQAAKALDALGGAALEALRKAGQSPDMEIRQRAARLVAVIDKRAEAAAVLAPTRVHLVCKDLPITDAVAALASKSKFDLQIAPASRANLARRKITLDTGAVSFWEALDLLCHKAGLVEIGGQQGNIQFATYSTVTPVRVRLPRGVLPVQPLLPLQPLPAPVQRLLPQINPARGRGMPRQGRGGLQIRGGGRGVVQVMPANLAYLVPAPVANPGQILLGEGKPASLPTCFAGAFRIRLRTDSPPRQAAGDVCPIQVEVAAEPRLQGWSALGSPRIELARDEQGRELTVTVESNGYVSGRSRIGSAVYEVNPYGGVQANQQMFRLQVKRDGKQFRALKAFKGSLVTQIQVPPEALITVNNILKAAGTTVKGTRGGSIKVLEVSKDALSNYKVRFELDRPSSVAASQGVWGGGGGVWQVQRIQVGFRGGVRMARPLMMTTYGPAGGMTLVDARGQPLQTMGMSTRGGNGVFEQTMTFRPSQGQGAPVKLVYSDRRLVTVDVPFHFQDARLPR